MSKKNYKLGDRIKFWYFWYRYGYQKTKMTGTGRIIKIYDDSKTVQVKKDSKRLVNVLIDRIITKIKEEPECH